MRITGVIADDFTGATDVAAAFTARGYRSEVIIGSSALRTGATTEAEVVVVALKTRTTAPEEAVAQSIEALRELRALGFTRFYFKYCSTFDSTDRGNIGPVLDALRSATGARQVIVAPAFPDNGRTVYQGHLFVGDDLLENSSMRNHPLTPMTRSRVRDLLADQTAETVGEIHLASITDRDLRGALDDSAETYLVLDTVDDTDLAVIAVAVDDAVLVSGGSGLALGAPLRDYPVSAEAGPVRGRRLVVCGSASARTREQIAAARSAGSPVLSLDVQRASSQPETVIDEAVSWILSQDPSSAPVVTSVGSGAVAAPSPESAELVERLISEIAARAVESGFREIIVGGGETSGAVVQQLGIEVLAIGRLISPGVCWARARTASGTEISLALKSGNFGDADMFITAWKALE
jgi:uncharacterized protein YgbK (DUF1537 family)